TASRSSNVSDRSDDTCPPPARADTARESIRALAKASSLAFARARPLAWSARPGHRPASSERSLMAMTEAPSARRLLTIGTVCSRLKDEFPEVSISKIRYLEDQGLLTPRRTQGGYRLSSEDD